MHDINGYCMFVLLQQLKRDLEARRPAQPKPEPVTARPRPGAALARLARRLLAPAAVARPESGG